MIINFAVKGIDITSNYDCDFMKLLFSSWLFKSRTSSGSCNWPHLLRLLVIVVDLKLMLSPNETNWNLIAYYVVLNHDSYHNASSCWFCLGSWSIRY